jgi:hypothetical protein
MGRAWVVKHGVDDGINGNGVSREACSGIGWSAVVKGVTASTGPAAAAFLCMYVVAIEEGVKAENGRGGTGVEGGPF